MYLIACLNFEIRTIKRYLELAVRTKIGVGPVLLTNFLLQVVQEGRVKDIVPTGW